MDISLVLLVVSTGIFAGFINTLAGSGSLLTLPVLMFLGLPANIANATNRVAIFLQSAVGVATFKQQKRIPPRQTIPMLTGSAVGATAGAIWAVEINEQVLEYFIGGLLLFMLFIMVWKPEKWIREHADDAKPRHWAVQFCIYLLTGLYGGFIQAGVGFFLLAALVLGSGYDLIRANALKLLIVMVFTVFALIVFIVEDQINWQWGLILAAGNMVGAFLGAKAGMKFGQRFIRYIMMLMLAVAAAKLFQVF